MESYAGLLIGWQWPESRGADGAGKAQAPGLPLTWSETSNIRWKTAIHARAWSSPVVLDGRIYVTFGSPGTAALDTASGKVLWERRDLECNHFGGGHERTRTLSTRTRRPRRPSNVAASM